MLLSTEGCPNHIRIGSPPKDLTGTPRFSPNMRGAMTIPDAVCFAPFNAAHIARCTARHGVVSHADPPTIECA